MVYFSLRKPDAQCDDCGITIPEGSQVIAPVPFMQAQIRISARLGMRDLFLLLCIIYLRNIYNACAYNISSHGSGLADSRGTPDNSVGDDYYGHMSSVNL